MAQAQSAEMKTMQLKIKELEFNVLKKKRSDYLYQTELYTISKQLLMNYKHVSPTWIYQQNSKKIKHIIETYMNALKSNSFNINKFTKNSIKLIQTLSNLPHSSPPKTRTHRSISSDKFSFDMTHATGEETVATPIDLSENSDKNNDVSQSKDSHSHGSNHSNSSNSSHRHSHHTNSTTSKNSDIDGFHHYFRRMSSRDDNLDAHKDAAVKIQSFWKGYYTRKSISQVNGYNHKHKHKHHDHTRDEHVHGHQHDRNREPSNNNSKLTFVEPIREHDNVDIKHKHNAAIQIQKRWRGHFRRKSLSKEMAILQDRKQKLLARREKYHKELQQQEEQELELLVRQKTNSNAYESTDNNINNINKPNSRPLSHRSHKSSNSNQQTPRSPRHKHKSQLTLDTMPANDMKPRTQKIKSAQIISHHRNSDVGAVTAANMSLFEAAMELHSTRNNKRNVRLSNGSIPSKSMDVYGAKEAQFLESITSMIMSQVSKKLDLRSLISKATKKAISDEFTKKRRKSVESVGTIPELRRRRSTGSATDSSVQLRHTNRKHHKETDLVSEPVNSASKIKELFTHVLNNRHKEVQHMLASGLSADSRDDQGNTILHIASQNGNKRVIKAALRWGADINAQNKHGQTALHYLHSFKFDELASYMKSKGADDSIENIHGLTCYQGLKPLSNDAQPEEP